ncbi:MAG: hypothetical protein ABI427_05705 [Solirubrobacteraceae bacterium]
MDPVGVTTVYGVALDGDVRPGGTSTNGKSDRHAISRQALERVELEPPIDKHTSLDGPPGS